MYMEEYQWVDVKNPNPKRSREAKPVADILQGLKVVQANGYRGGQDETISRAS